MAMTDWKHLEIKEIAAVVCEHLKKYGIDATLVGGACVSIYTENKYQSWDLDFCTYTPVKKLVEPLRELGFVKKSGRHFENPQCDYFIEFVNPPVAVGSEEVTRTTTLETSSGRLQLLRPTDCVKDRLAAYFYWKDHQSLEQAIVLARSNRVNLAEIKRWSAKEKQLEKFEVFRRKLRSR